MRKKLGISHLIFASIAAEIVLLISCTKEFACEGCRELNKPPVANAGPDQFVILPNDSVTLDGTGSSDQDGAVTEWLWTKISGPASFAINNPSSSVTIVKNLGAGSYQFELKVTDAGGLFEMDTVQVRVLANTMDCNSNTAIAPCDGSSRPVVCAQLIPIGALSQARDKIAAASAGNKIVFAGGGGVYESGVAGNVTSRIDIYDITADAWSTAELTTERGDISATASGNKLLFAGGVRGDSWWDWLEFFSNVDIYDVSTNSWASAQLQTARVTTATAAGNKVVFAGEYGYNSCGSNCYTWGDPTNEIDIYDMPTNTWSRALLSEARWEISAVSLANRIYFAGGYRGSSSLYSNKIDIYDAAANTWSVAALSEPREIDDGGIAAGSKIFWAGGSITQGGTRSLTCKVEIFDVNTHTTSFASLSQPGYVKAVLRNDKVVFLKSKDAHSSGYAAQFDIYDLNTGAWSIGVLGQHLPAGAAIISVNNTIYVAGGRSNGSHSSQVWKLEF